MSVKSKIVEHAPNWFSGPLRVNAAGDTRPGFMCCHLLENGKGICGSTSFEESDTPHVCFVMLRGRWKFSRPCYDKYHRCPGWAGGGWKFGKHKLCDGGRVNVNYEDRWWTWRIHRCDMCDVIVLPYMVRYTSPREWWWEIRHFRSRSWFCRIETRWGRWRCK
jgi:hypothetical protein